MRLPAIADNLCVNDLGAFGSWIESVTCDTSDPPELCLQAVSTRPAPELLPCLTEAIDRACGWVLQRNMVSSTVLLMRVEAQGRALMDLYASLMAEGLDLSRESHMLLAERCTCTQVHQYARDTIISLRLQVTLPADLPLLFQWWSTGTA